MASKDNSKIITTALQRFRALQERESDNRQKALEELRFSLGDQWDDDVRRARENDPDGARPCLTVDKCDQYIRQVVNDARQNKPSIKPRPKDDGADVETAEVLQGLCRHIEDQSSADIAYDTAVEMAARCGFGFIRVVTEYVDAEKTEQDIFIREVRNPFSVYLDENEGVAFVFEDMPRAEFAAKYPEATGSEFDRVSNVSPDWIGEDHVRIAEYWETVTESKNVLTTDSGEELSEDDYWQRYAGVERPAIVDAREKKTRRVKWRKITATEVLEEIDWPSEYIGIVQTYGHRINVGGRDEWRGLVRPAMDAQRIYNYAASAFVERVSLSPKAPFILSVEQVEGHEHAWSKANTANQAYLPYNIVEGAPPPARQPGADVPAGWVATMQSMEHDIQAALGMYNATVGAPSNEKSGKAILARQKEGDVATYHIIDNLSRAIRQVGRIVIDLIPKIYYTARVVRILGEDGTEKFARIDPTQPQARVDRHDERGEIQSIYNPGVGRYDVTVTIGPAYSTKRQEAAEFLTQVIQSSPQMLQVAGDLMFRAMDMPFAEELAERMKKMLPPPLQDQHPPQVPPEMQQMQQYIQHLEGALADAKSGIEKAKIEADSREQVARINAAGKGDVEEIKGWIAMLMQHMQPPPGFTTMALTGQEQNEPPPGGFSFSAPAPAQASEYAHPGQNQSLPDDQTGL